jgi:hypothetical protein
MRSAHSGIRAIWISFGCKTRVWKMSRISGTGHNIVDIIEDFRTVLEQFEEIDGDVAAADSVRNSVALGHTL